MFNVTTKYVKINDERKKCFMIRDDESYVRTVDVVMTNTAPVSMEYVGFKTTLSVSLHRHRGTSTLTFYDGEEILGMVNTSSSTTTYTLSDVVLAWGVEHDLYAVYNGNKQTLNAKSNKIALNKPIPSELVTEMGIFDGGNMQVNEGVSSATVYAVVTTPSTIADGTLVYFYDGDELLGSSGTENNIATYTITSPTKGIHNIMARIPASSQLNEGSCTGELYVGYDVSITSYPLNDTFIIGQSNDVEVTVKYLNGLPKSSASVTFNGTTKSTNASGKATFTISSISGTTATATCNGSSSETRNVYTFTPTSMEFISAPPNTWIIRAGYPNYSIGVKINGTGTGSIVGLPLTGVFTSTGYEFSRNGNITDDNTAWFRYTGEGRGDVTLTASLGSTSSNRTFSDIIYGYNSVFQYVRTTGLVGCETATLPNYYQITFTEVGSYIKFSGLYSANTFQFTCKENGIQSYCVVKGGGYEVSGYYYEFQPSANNTYKFVYSNGTVTVYVNGVQTSSFSSGISDDWEIRLASTNGGVNTPLKLTDLRVYK